MGQLYEEISRWAGVAPANIAYRCGETRCSYAELIEAVEDLSKELATFDLGRGSLLAFQLSPGLEFLTALLAALKMDLFVAPIADTACDSEVGSTLSSLKPTHLLTSPGVDKGELASDKVIFSTSLDGHHLIGFDRELSLRLQEICPTGACIRYTSGTTGLAKGVVISQEAALSRVIAADAFFKLKPGDGVLSLLAMPYHFVVSVLNFLRAGACIIKPRTTAPAELVKCFETTDCQVVYGSPFHYDVLVGVAKSCPETLRLAVSTSTTLRQETAKRFYSKFGRSISDSYGIIELGIPLSLDDNHDLDWGVLGSVLPGYEACVHDETGFHRSGRGTLMIKGPGMFDAYLEPYTPCSEVLTDSWFETGDIAEINEKGHIRIYGRRSSAIHIAGFKVFPEEIESVLMEHEAVEDAHVQEVRHPSSGNTIHARIVCAKGFEVSSQELSRFCRERLGGMKTPHDFEFTSQLERTSSGKLKRSQSA